MSGRQPSPAPPISPEADAFVKAIGTAADLPAFVRNVRAITSVASNLEARVTQLEDAITQDLSLSAKVLRIANSVTVSGLGGSATIGSVKQAIMLLGYDRVQHLASAASVFEKIENDAPSTRDLMVESVLTANQSLHLAVAAGFEAPELAYLCGLFRRLGEVLVACYRAPAYRKWQEALATRNTVQDGDEASHFGFSFQEVGMALAHKWGIPAAVVRTMRPCKAMTSDGDPLHVITQGSADLARCQYGTMPSSVTPEQITARLAPALGVDAAEITVAMEAGVAEARPALGKMSVDLDRWLSSQAVRRRADQERRQQASSAGGPAGSAVSTGATPPGVAAIGADPGAAPTVFVAPPPEVDAGQLAPNATDSAKEAELRERVRGLVATSRSASGGESMASATQSALMAAFSAGFERGVLAVASDDGKVLRGRLGLGRGGQELAREFLMRPVAAAGPLGAALEQRLDLFAVMDDPASKGAARDRLVRELKPSHFALLPIVVEGRLLGCLYFDATGKGEPPTETSRQLVGTLRDQLAFLFAQRRVAERAAGSAAA